MASIAILIERIAFCFLNKTWMRYGAMKMKKRVIPALVLVSVVVVLIAVAAVTPYRVVCTVLTVDELREMRTEPYQTFLQAMDDAEQEQDCRCQLACFRGALHRGKCLEIGLLYLLFAIISIHRL